MDPSPLPHPFSVYMLRILVCRECGVFYLLASEALKLMHRLAADPGIVAMMKKHRWWVGIMIEMAQVGYVGVSTKCILGFNKDNTYQAGRVNASVSLSATSLTWNLNIGTATAASEFFIFSSHNTLLSCVSC